MDAESASRFLLALPHVAQTVSQTVRWGDKLVFRVGDRGAGGKMFSQIDFREDGRAILSFAVTPEQFHELTQGEGVLPAPYRARIHWIALMDWNAMEDAQLKGLLREANRITFEKLPKRLQSSLVKNSGKRPRKH